MQKPQKAPYPVICGCIGFSVKRPELLPENDRKCHGVEAVRKYIRRVPDQGQKFRRSHGDHALVSKTQRRQLVLFSGADDAHNGQALLSGKLPDRPMHPPVIPQQIAQDIPARHQPPGCILLPRLGRKQQRGVQRQLDLPMGDPPQRIPRAAFSHRNAAERLYRLPVQGFLFPGDLGRNAGGIGKLERLLRHKPQQPDLVHATR